MWPNCNIRVLLLNISTAFSNYIDMQYLKFTICQMLPDCMLLPKLQSNEDQTTYGSNSYYLLKLNSTCIESAGF